VWDRTDRDKEQGVGRFDLNLREALPYLPKDATPEPTVEHTRFGTYDEFDDDESEFEASEEQAQWKQVVEAACVWLRDITANNTHGEEWCRYRVRIYGPKGMRVLHTATFVVRSLVDVEQLPAKVVESAPSPTAPSVIPAPSFEGVEVEGAATGMRALGDYYAQWGRIVLGSVGQLQSVNNDMLGRLHHQLEESRGQVDTLVASILESKVAQLQVSETRQIEEQQDQARHALAREAISQLGDTAKAFLAARGVTPELAEVLEVLGQSPELVAALNDPDVRALMQDPSNLSDLAKMLKMVGQQARAAQQANAVPPAAPETPAQPAS